MTTFAPAGGGSPFRLLVVAAALPFLVGPAAAREWRVLPGSALATPQAALQQAAEGDVIRVASGTYRGPLVVDRRVHLVGEGWPVLDGGGKGIVVTVMPAAAGTAITGFVVQGSGDLLENEEGGISVTAPNVEIAGNRLRDVLFGITLSGAAGALVSDNEIVGKELDLARRGDLIRLWESPGARVERNVAVNGRDLVLWYSARLVVKGNRVEGSRYGLHFMFCDGAEIAGNVLRDNSVGAFLMYSRRLQFVGNTLAGNRGPSGYGIGLKDIDDFALRGNRFAGNRVGIFLDNSPREAKGSAEVSGNLLAGGEVGIRLMPNVTRLDARDNSFVENQQQVELSGGGGDAGSNHWRGNYWSDYAGFDADGDGVGDVPYRAERLFEDLVDRRPEMRLFLHSPATRAVDFAATAFPIVRPQAKLTDEAPRLRPLLTAAVAAGKSSATPERGLRPLAAGLLGGGAALALPLLALRRRWASPLPPSTSNRAATAPAASASDTPTPREDPTAMSAPPLLRVRDLGKRFGEQPVLSGLSFDVQAGEAVALWGANGAGKTTALRALLGAFPCAGSVEIDGLDVRRDGKAARRLLGFVPQEIAFPEMRAGEALRLFAGLHGAHPDRLAPLVARLGLQDELDKRVQTLSGGRKQRLALAVALIADPPLLLLDEPTSNLDAASRRELLALLLALKAEGKTLIFSSHRPDEVLRLADRVLHLEGGRLLADLPPAALLAREVAEVDLRCA